MKFLTLTLAALTAVSAQSPVGDTTTTPAPVTTSSIAGNLTVVPTPTSVSEPIFTNPIEHTPNTRLPKPTWNVIAINGPGPVFWIPPEENTTSIAATATITTQTPSGTASIEPVPATPTSTTNGTAPIAPIPTVPTSTANGTAPVTTAPVTTAPVSGTPVMPVPAIPGNNNGTGSAGNGTVSPGNGTQPSGNGTSPAAPGGSMICGTTTVTVGGTVTTVTASTYTSLPSNATTVIIVPQPVTCGNATTTVNVVIPVVGGTPLAPTAQSTLTATTSGDGDGKTGPKVTAPVAISASAQKLVAGTLAAFIAAAAFIA